MIHRLLVTILASVLPERAAVKAIKSLPPDHLITLLALTKKHRVTALLPFQNPTVRNTIHALKFYNNHHASVLLAAALADTLTCISNANQKPIALCPIPLSSKRLRSRGHNQVATVITTMMKTNQRADMTVVPHLLTRIRDTNMQSHLSRSARLNNLHHCFSVNQSVLRSLTGHQILIIDDVVTTGTTLGEAARTIRPHLPPQATLSLLAFAY